MIWVQSDTLQFVDRYSTTNNNDNNDNNNINNNNNNNKNIAVTRK